MKTITVKESGVGSVRQILVCLAAALLLNAASFSMMSGRVSRPLKLLIKIATRSRPQAFFKFLDLYYENLSYKNPYQFIISCDLDDSAMNNASVRAKFATYPNLMVCYGASRNKIHACNRDIERCADFDVVLLSSDDMKPVLKDFDQVIADKMLEYFPDTDGVLNFFDGSAEQSVNTYPVIGRKFYDRFGFVYHPHYTSLWCDNELSAVSRMLGREIVFPTITLLLHCHYANGGVAVNDRLKCDELYARNECLDGKDRILFAERKFLNFNLSPDGLRYIKLSVCIVAHKNDAGWLNKIVSELTTQATAANLLGATEIMPLVVGTDTSEAQIAAMNKLIINSHGEYVCFIEPGSRITSDYLSEIHKHLANHPDYVSIGWSTKNKKNESFFSAIETPKSLLMVQKSLRTRLLTFCYLNPTRHDIALQAVFRVVRGYPEIDWARQIVGTGQLLYQTFISKPVLILSANSHNKLAVESRFVGQRKERKKIVKKPKR